MKRPFDVLACFRPAPWVAALLGAALAGPTLAQSRGEVLARVNDRPVPRALLDELVRSRQSPNPFDAATGIAPTPAAIDRTQLFDEVLLTEVLAQAAIARGLDREPSLVAQRQLQANTVLSQQIVRGVITQVSVSPEEVAALYEEQVPPFDFKVQRLVVADEAEARALLDRLKRGEPFAALARRHASGGSGDWLMFNQMEPQVASAVRHLKPREPAAAPVRVNDGWAVLRLEDRRTAPRPPLDQATVWLKPRLLQQKVQAKLDAMRQSAQIELLPPR